MTETNKQKAIEYCLNTFNFERVKKAMDQADWKWYTRNGYHVPTLVQLILATQKRLDEAWERKTTVESGGIRAVYVPGEVDNDGKVEPPGLELMFILTQTQSY
jgi:hypothetical protein